MRVLLSKLAIAGLVMGCGAEGGQDSRPDLVIQQDTALSEGSLRVAGTRVFFRSAQVEEHVFDITVRFNGLTITALVDQARGVMEYDGYASENGVDTQMTAPDRAVLLAFSRGLDELGLDVATTTDMLRKFTNTWAEFPDTLALQRQTIAQTTRSYWSLCAYMNDYFSSHHDCNTCDFGSDECTLGQVDTSGGWTYYYGVGSYLSMDSDCGAADGAYFWKDGSWQCYEPDHDTSVEYAYGNCFGRCGAGCGSSTQFTEDCNNHDECVRVGHDLASFWCDDQFAATTDDWASAPNCL